MFCKKKCLVILMVLTEVVLGAPVDGQKVTFAGDVEQNYAILEKTLVDYLSWCYDQYVDRKVNDIGNINTVEELDDRMLSDQPASPEFGELSPLFMNLSSMVNFTHENHTDIEYIRTMRNRRESITEDRTKDTWIQILKDNILRQVGRVNTTATLFKPREKMDTSGLNISQWMPGFQIPNNAMLDDEFFSEKIRSYYPSCDIPKTIDQDLWKDENIMNLYFNLEYPQSNGISIATSTLRLYRVTLGNTTNLNVDSSCEISSPDEHLMRISIYWYTKSLKRQRVKRRLSDSKVIGENAKWVELSVLPATKAWNKGKNLGLAITLEDQEGSALKVDKYFKGASCMRPQNQYQRLLSTQQDMQTNWTVLIAILEEIRQQPSIIMYHCFQQ
ncbi:hypothetical protein FQA39_LY17816 [Lamprigera yunnana]|nr:hypothetical protein FQA39_LY17816 [Lamprigera yunnana]